MEGWRCGEVPWRRSKGQSAPASPGTVEEPAQHSRHVCGQVRMYIVGGVLCTLYEGVA